MTWVGRVVGLDQHLESTYTEFWLLTQPRQHLALNLEQEIHRQAKDSLKTDVHLDSKPLSRDSVSFEIDKRDSSPSPWGYIQAGHRGELQQGALKLGYQAGRSICPADVLKMWSVWIPKSGHSIRINHPPPIQIVHVFYLNYSSLTRQLLYVI